MNYKVSNLSATLGLCATLFVLSASLVSSHLYEASGWWLSCQFNSNLVSTCVIPELPFTLKTCNFLGGPGIVIGGHNHVLSGKIPCPRPFVCPFDFRDTFCSDEDMFFLIAWPCRRTKILCPHYVLVRWCVLGTLGTCTFCPFEDIIFWSPHHAEGHIFSWHHHCCLYTYSSLCLLPHQSLRFTMPKKRPVRQKRQHNKTALKLLDCHSPT